MDPDLVAFVVNALENVGVAIGRDADDEEILDRGKVSLQVELDEWL